MSETTPFRANAASTIRIGAATGPGGAIRLPGAPAGGGCQVRVRNRGAVEVFVQFGRSDVIAAAPGAAPGSVGIAAGAVEFWTIQQNEHFVAVAVETGTPSLEVTTGTGG